MWGGWLNLEFSQGKIKLFGCRQVHSDHGDNCFRSRQVHSDHLDNYFGSRQVHPNHGAPLNPENIHVYELIKIMGIFKVNVIFDFSKKELDHRTCYKDQISGERYQDHWFSVLFFSLSFVYFVNLLRTVIKRHASPRNLHV